VYVVDIGNYRIQTFTPVEEYSTQAFLIAGYYLLFLTTIILGLVAVWMGMYPTPEKRLQEGLDAGNSLAITQGSDFGPEHRVVANISTTMEADLELFLADFRTLEKSLNAQFLAQQPSIKRARVLIFFFCIGIVVVCWWTIPFEYALVATISFAPLFVLMYVATNIAQAQTRVVARAISLAKDLKFVEVGQILTNFNNRLDQSLQVAKSHPRLVKVSIAQIQETQSLFNRLVEQMKVNQALSDLCDQWDVAKREMSPADILTKISELEARCDAERFKIHPALRNRLQKIHNFK
jgi:hypothetical protein